MASDAPFPPPRSGSAGTPPAPDAAPRGDGAGARGASRPGPRHARRFVALWALGLVLATGWVARRHWRDQAALDERRARYASLLAKDVWVLDDESARRSLRLIAEAEGFERVWITLPDGDEFATSAAANVSLAEVPDSTVPISWDGRTLGHLRAVHGPLPIALYASQWLAILLLCGLAHLAAARSLHRREIARVRLESELAHRAEVEARLAQREKELARAERLSALGRIAGGIAHDFNNILAVIVTSAGLARDSTDEVHVHGHVDALLEATQRARRLTSQLLSFGRPRSMTPSRVCLDDVVESMQDMLRRILPDRVEVEFELSAPDRAVLADPAHLEQILMNLVVNARDAMPDGGRVLVRTARERRGEQVLVRLDVEDTGVGMDEDLKREIFEPFFTTKPAGTGTGLGLATVATLAQRSDAELTVESAPGEGSCFSVLFASVAAPRRRTAAASRAASPPPSPPIAEALAGRLLLVEDDDGVRRQVGRLLERAGVDVVTASDPFDALGILESEHESLDLVLSDVSLPHFDGAQLRERARERGLHVPFLFMSGHVPSDTPIADSELVYKPFSADELFAAVRRITATGRREAAG